MNSIDCRKCPPSDVTADFLKERISWLTELSFPEHCGDFLLDLAVIESMLAGRESPESCGGSSRESEWSREGRAARSFSSSDSRIFSPDDASCPPSEASVHRRTAEVRVQRGSPEGFTCNGAGGESAGDGGRGDKKKAVDHVANVKRCAKSGRGDNAPADRDEADSRLLHSVKRAKVSGSTPLVADTSLGSDEPSPEDEEETIDRLFKEAISLKRVSDTQWKQSKQVEVLDLYFQSCLKFIEVAARYERRSKTPHSKDQDIPRSLKMYQDLVSANSMIPYYIMNCQLLNKAERVILGHRCSVMVNTRIWMLTVSDLSTKLSKLLESGVIHVEEHKSFFQSIKTILKFNKQYQMSEFNSDISCLKALPKHPFVLDPLEFIQCVQADMKSLEALEGKVS